MVEIPVWMIKTDEIKLIRRNVLANQIKLNLNKDAVNVFN